MYRAGNGYIPSVLLDTSKGILLNWTSLRIEEQVRMMAGSPLFELLPLRCAVWDPISQFSYFRTQLTSINTKQNAFAHMASTPVAYVHR